MEPGTTQPPVPLVISSNQPNTSTHTGHASVTSSIYTIFGTGFGVVIIIFFISRLIRCFLRHLRGSSYQVSFSRFIPAAGTNPEPALSEKEKLKLIDSLPLFTLASHMAKLRKSSPDCAVCCDPFVPDAQLRLLPACRHAFHKSCIDKWLKSNPSCPLCRSPITLPHPPLPDLSSGSFRLELGNISHRTSEPDSQDQDQNRTQPVSPPPNIMTTYSLDSYDYLIEEEVEIILPPPPPPPPPSRPPQTTLALPSAPQLIESLRREEPVRGWLQEYVDRIATSASSSFNSLRFPSQRCSDSWSGRWSQRSSQRFDSGRMAAPPPDTWLWDLEAGPNEEARGLFAFYRWLAGVQ